MCQVFIILNGVYPATDLYCTNYLPQSPIMLKYYHLDRCDHITIQLTPDTDKIESLLSCRKTTKSVSYSESGPNSNTSTPRLRDCVEIIVNLFQLISEENSRRDRGIIYNFTWVCTSHNSQRKHVIVAARACACVTWAAVQETNSWRLGYCQVWGASLLANAMRECTALVVYFTMPV